MDILTIFLNRFIEQNNCHNEDDIYFITLDLYTIQFEEYAFLL